jgi:Lysozyme like domain/Repeat of unknown function (DUF346)
MTRVFRILAVILLAALLTGGLPGAATAGPARPTTPGQAQAPTSLDGPASTAVAPAAVAADAADLCAEVGSQAGFSGDRLVTAVAVALAESGCNPSARGVNPPTSGCPNGSVDRGLWQINNCYHAEVSDACAYDAQCNANAAYRISSGGTNWTPWSTYNSGAYLSYLAQAQAAVDRLQKPGVDVASWGSGRLDVFARGNDQQLWHKWFDNGQWSGWEPLGGTLTSDPTAVSRSDGIIDVFARGGDNQLVHRSFVRGRGWSAWMHHGGTLTSAPDAASWGAQRVDVFARGGDNQLVHLYFNGSWAPSWDHLGGTLTSAPSAVSWGPNRIDVFARGSGDELVHRYYSGGWAGSWDHLGGTLTSGPDAASWGSGRLDVFARGGGNELVHRYYSGSWAATWDHLGGTLYSDPGAVSWGPNRIDVLARGGGDELVQRYYASGWAATWTHLGNLP